MAVSPALDIDASVRATTQDAAAWKAPSSGHSLLNLIGNYIDYKRELSAVDDMFSHLRCHMRASVSGSAQHSVEQEAVMALSDSILCEAHPCSSVHVGQRTVTGEQIKGA